MEFDANMDSWTRITSTMPDTQMGAPQKNSKRFNDTAYHLT